MENGKFTIMNEKYTKNNKLYYTLSEMNTAGVFFKIDGTNAQVMKSMIKSGRFSVGDTIEISYAKLYDSSFNDVIQFTLYQPSSYKLWHKKGSGAIAKSNPSFKA